MTELLQGMPRPGEAWQHKEGGIYIVRDVGVWNLWSSRPITCVFYSHLDQSPEIYIRDLPQFMKNFTRVDQ
jgi:hypothetical protein